MNTELITISAFIAEKQLGERAAKNFRKFVYTFTTSAVRAKRNSRYERTLLEEIWECWCNRQKRTAPAEEPTRSHIALAIAAAMAFSALSDFALGYFL